MKIRIFLCAVLLAVMMFPGDGSSYERRGGRKGRPESAKTIFAELGITNEQEAKLKEIRESAASAINLHKKQIEVQQEKIKQELQKDKPSKSVLKKCAAETGKIHRQISQVSIDSRLKMKEILTPEQFNKLSERGFTGERHGQKMKGGRKSSGDGEGAMKKRDKPHGYCENCPHASQCRRKAGGPPDLAPPPPAVPLTPVPPIGTVPPEMLEDMKNETDSGTDVDN